MNKPERGLRHRRLLAYEWSSARCARTALRRQLEPSGSLAGIGKRPTSACSETTRAGSCYQRSEGRTQRREPKRKWASMVQSMSRCSAFASSGLLRETYGFGQTQKCVAARVRNLPVPIWPTNLPSRTCTWPRTVTRLRPAFDVPAFERAVVDRHLLRLRRNLAAIGGVVHHEVGVAADGDRALARVQAEQPGRLRAGGVDERVQVDPARGTRRACRAGSRGPRRDGMPLGIFVKSPRPISFWPAKSNGAWSVATVLISRERSAFHSAGWCDLSRSGGDMTYLAPSKSGFSA